MESGVSPISPNGAWKQHYGARQFVLLLDADLRVKDLNALAENLLGVTGEIAKQPCLWEIVPELRSGLFEHKLYKALQEGETQEFEFYLSLANAWYLCLVEPLRRDLLVTMTDSTVLKSLQLLQVGTLQSTMTERQRQATLRQLQDMNIHLEERIEERTSDLLEKERLLHDLISDLTMTESRERRQLADELHDYLPQMLVATKMKLARVQRSELDDAQRTQLAGTVEILDEALRYTRTLVANLSPTILFQFGLEAALPKLTEQMQEHGLKVHIGHEGKTQALPENKATFAYRAIRELLFNIIKHAGVFEASVFLRWEPGTLQIVVEDGGKGFAPKEWEEAHSADSGKFGLFSIQERLEAFEGSYRVRSAPGEGAAIYLTLPLE